MKPYSNNNYKVYAEKTDHVSGYSKGVSKTDKLLTRNENRSFKKQERVKAKKEINDELQNITVI
jgi:hypothetical protein